MPFWTYSQNNTGGSFDYDPNRGISNYVIVEAENADAADERAREIGLYFDGAGDCSCCGNRWYESYGEGDEAPSIYGDPVDDHDPLMKWIDGYEAFVHHADGVVTGHLPYK